MTPITFIFGTRPEWIKIAPVVRELRARAHKVVIICTGQHTDLLEGMPEMQVDKNLGIASQGNVFQYVQEVTKVLHQQHGNILVVVQGDTASAYAGALFASTRHHPLVHLEAGVRSHADEPWPEEHIRRAITEMADLHVCTTQVCQQNVLNEGVDLKRAPLTGSPVVTSLREFFNDEPPMRRHGKVLVTLHRRELHQRADLAKLIEQLFFCISQHPEIEFVWPVHPVLRTVVGAPNLPANLTLVPAMGYAPFLRFLAGARAVLTDSGGVVEEAATLGVPTAILRDHNDRPEAVEAGVAQRFNVSAGEIWNAINFVDSQSKERPARWHDTYGTLDSARRCAEEIVRFANE